MMYALDGTWQVQLKDGSSWQMQVPGTLDENQIGYKDAGANQWHPDATLGNDAIFDEDAPIATRLTRKYTYEGEARLTRMVDYVPEPGKRVFLEVERARCLRLLVNGCEVPHFQEWSISAPHVFEVTGLLDGKTEVTLLSDNSYPGLPHDAIVFSSAATDETQTNWNGVLGYVRLRTEEAAFLQSVRVYPRTEGAQIKVTVSSAVSGKCKLTLCSKAFAQPLCKEVELVPGSQEICVGTAAYAEDIAYWDEFEGNLYEVQAELEGYESKTVTFGVRRFGDDGTGRLALNGRKIFIRSEANCAEFPEEGHPPVTVEEWTKVLEKFRSYGVNLMRFHSHTPPEAAFTAADRMGMLMQPELSHWNPRDAFEAEDAWAYYQIELRQTIRMLANHPSFVMMTFGNELWTGDLGKQRMNQLLDQAHELDDTRLYANASNAYYGTEGCDPQSDFYTGMGYYDHMLRGISAGEKKTNGRLQGHINNQYPNAKTNYEEQMGHLRETYQKPVFEFEVGQFEILPDFDELEDFKGISDPANLRLIQEKVQKSSLEPVWKQYVEATGELSRIGYREETEAALRSPSISGLSLLGIQDFPGQGTALVGMMNSHLQAKPFDFAKPERFAEFFAPQLPLVLLDKYTYEAGETLQADVQIANYAKEELHGPLCYELKQGECVIAEGKLEDRCFPAGELTAAGRLEIALAGIDTAMRLDLTVSVETVCNTYPIWVYPPLQPVCPENVYETEKLDEAALKVLQAGGCVYLTPPATQEALPSSIQTQFTTDFWSVGTFPYQAGGMGQLIDTQHPIFETFPTEFHTNWQWWPMAVQRAVILPQTIKSIITEMDSYAYLRPMSQLFECRCAGGTLLFSSMGLQNLQQYPEARALLNSIYTYLGSEKFAPEQELDAELIASLVK